ncbi:hypothetical protein A3770_03p27450 [Chloropicon primus]|uniref:Uncharacterized protein n=2 Tax=Chloropicon primus TaxID=1764295 RepID=A0A5B8MIF2_9CHLO|nr:hypothetical protein A3770_03p27450 [Chloropicon primus]|eukprot:QDZ20227.1 hypothetical protein A3770_03p27450 [Chloropicon primus]
MRRTTRTGPTTRKTGGRRRRTRRRCEREGRRSKDKIEPTSDANLGTRLAWYASEAFGDAVALVRGRGDGGDATATTGEEKKNIIAWDEAVQRLRDDYDRTYFVTGKMDLGLYEEDCEFADPFVSFRGVARFKKNLDNLGALMKDVTLVVDSFEEIEEEGTVSTKWKFKCVLGLPWSPRLSASGGTKHVFNRENRMVQHVESWDIDPSVALRQLVTPGKAKK